MNLVSKGTHVKLKKTKKKIHSSIPFFLHIKRCGHIIKNPKVGKRQRKWVCKNKQYSSYQQKMHSQQASNKIEYNHQTNELNVGHGTRMSTIANKKNEAPMYTQS